MFWRLQIRLLAKLWSFEKMYHINTLKQELSTVISINCLKRGLSLIDIDAIGVFSDEDHSKRPTYTGYLNFIKYPISHVLVLIL